MRTESLDFPYPDHLIAADRPAAESHASRVMWVESGEPRELVGGISALLEAIPVGDCLVINDTRVVKRRLFTLNTELEILFLAPLDSDARRWRVLCPSSRWRDGVVQTLPDGVGLKLVERGRTQVVESDQSLRDDYFETFGELPLPPYIQKARAERHQRQTDELHYQTQWAEKQGSLAAPTASLHFTGEDLKKLEARGVRVLRITLHVGLGTFLPVTVDDLNEHVMHSESVVISPEVWRELSTVRAAGGSVWAMGTTVARALESAACARLPGTAETGFVGETDLLIQPGFQWRVVDRLLTNFHQPRSTLLALVASFAGLEIVKDAYAWAIAREFRLFSYGDLSVWIRARPQNQ